MHQASLKPVFGVWTCIFGCMDLYLGWTCILGVSICLLGVWNLSCGRLDLSGAKQVCFEDLNKDMFLEVKNETCS